MLSFLKEGKEDYSRHPSVGPSVATSTIALYNPLPEGVPEGEARLPYHQHQVLRHRPSPHLHLGGELGLVSALRLGHRWLVRIGWCAAARILLVVWDNSELLAKGLTIKD